MRTETYFLFWHVTTFYPFIDSTTYFFLFFFALIKSLLALYVTWAPAGPGKKPAFHLCQVKTGPKISADKTASWELWFPTLTFSLFSDLQRQKCKTKLHLAVKTSLYVDTETPEIQTAPSFLHQSSHQTLPGLFPEKNPKTIRIEVHRGWEDPIYNINKSYGCTQ